MSQLSEALELLASYSVNPLMTPDEARAVETLKAAARNWQACESELRRVEWCDVHGSVATGNVFHDGVRVCQYAWYSGHTVEPCSVVLMRLIAIPEEEKT